MTTWEIVGIAAAVYLVVGFVTWTLMKSASDADDVMETWYDEKGDFCVHDD